MQRWFVSFGLACGSAGILAGSVSAQVQVQIQIQAQPAQIQILPAQPIGGKAKMLPSIMAQQTRLTQADAIFVGRVIAIEPMDVDAPPAAGQANVKYRVAVIQVSESIFGLKKDTQNVRVAFLAQPNFGGGFNGGGVQILPAIQPLPPNGPAIRRAFPGIVQQMNLTVGQDGLFTLNKHHKENFYLAPSYTSFVSRDNNPGFDGEVKTAKQLAKVMGNPAAALKADDKDDRYLAAAVLIAKYRNVSNPTGAPMKQEPIDAEESKLILKAIAGGDWTVGRFNATIPNPLELFNQLGINQKDGYNPVNLRTQQDIAQAMQKWLDENDGKYRITRQVVDPNAKAPVAQPGVIQPGVFQPGINRPGVHPIQVQPAPAPAPKSDR